MPYDPSSNNEARIPVVWLVNEGGHDYASLKEYGRVVPLTRGGVNPFAPDRLMIMIAPRLALAKEEDFLAISGLPILNALAMCMWLKKFGKVNLLQFSTKQGVYVRLHVSDAAIERNALVEPGPAD